MGSEALRKARKQIKRCLKEHNRLRENRSPPEERPEPYSSSKEFREYYSSYPPDSMSIYSPEEEKRYQGNHKKI